MVEIFGKIREIIQTHKKNEEVRVKDSVLDPQKLSEHQLESARRRASNPVDQIILENEKDRRGVPPVEV